MKRADATSEFVETAAAQWVARRDAGLTAAEDAELSQWLQHDGRHAAAFARFAATWATIGRPRRTGAAVDLAREVVGRQRRRRLRVLGAAGAAAMVLLATGYLWSPRADRDAAAVASRTVLLTPESQTLSDGSVVELKAGAKIAVEFTAALRRVRLVQGEAHFAVAKNPARPFVVVAADIEVRAVGTAFAVNHSASSIGLLVTEGRVSVDRPQGSGAITATGSHPAPFGSSAASTLLAFVDAGHQVEIESVAPPTAPWRINPISAHDLAERLAWRAPSAEFSGTPLVEVISVINRHTRERFVIEDSELARVPLSGRFRLEDGAAFLRLLETGFGVQAEHRGERVIVLRKSGR